MIFWLDVKKKLVWFGKELASPSALAADVVAGDGRPPGLAAREVGPVQTSGN